MSKANNVTAVSFDEADHPLLAVKRGAARVSDLLQLWLDAETEVFSSSVREILRTAAAHARADDAGLRVVGAPAFLAATLDYARRWLARSQSPGLKNILLEFLLRSAPAAAAEPKETTAQRTASEAQDDVDDAAVAVAVTPPWLTDVLVDAARNTYRLAGRSANTGVSELVLAALRSGEFQDVLFGPVDEQSLRQQALAGLRQDCERVLHETSDARMKEWGALLSDLQALAPPGPVAESARHYVADRPLQSLREDVIGTSQDARALAEVICLREPGPPLAVGLFGDWGSGKSTFMNMLEAAVDEIAERSSAAANETEKAGNMSDTLFIRKAVHIRFNAWTYNDANLWASLASEFFQQLRFGGYRYTGGAVYERLVRTVAQHVARAEGRAAEKADEVVSARARLRRLGAELQTIERRREQRENDALAAIGKDLVVAAIGHGDGAREALQALGYTIPSDEQAQEKLRRRLSRDIADIARAPGQLAAAWRVARLLLARVPSGRAAGGFWALVILTVLLVLGVLIWGESAALLAPLVTAVGALAAVWRVAKPILQRVARHMEAADGKISADEEALARKREEVAREQQRAAHAEADYAAAQAEAARFRGGRPEQVLEFFLGASTELNALRQELGTVSRVRRAFEELDAIMRAAAAERGRVRGSPSAAAQLLHDFDRIVIYIDDLDRCRADQVVKVLEAVHLLLAFPLFVVVVGVDPRWLMNSLRHFYASELGHGDAHDAGDEDLRAVPKEYLEKIFQIPVNLRGLTQGADGTFRRLIDSIAGPRQVEAPSATLEPSADGAPGPDGRRYQIQPVFLPLAEPETLAQTTERVAMTADEIDVMTAMGPLAGTSPRAVKRLVNVYRFVRGLYRGKRLETFLRGTPNKRPGPRCVAVLFWLALDCGMPSEQTRRLRAAVAAMSERSHTIADLRLASRPRPDSRRPRRLTPAVWSVLEAFWQGIPAQQRDEYAGAFEKIELRLPGTAGFEVLKEALQETERFSFASLHDEAQR